MAYEDLTVFARTIGLLYLLGLFSIVLVYALRPKAGPRFNAHARIPLRED